MTFHEWINPLLDYYKHEPIVFTDYIRANKRGTFSVRSARRHSSDWASQPGICIKPATTLSAWRDWLEALVESGVME